MHFKNWLLVEDETKVMILPWPKIKKMGLDKFASGEALKGAYLDASKFNFAKPNFEDAILNNRFYSTGEINPGYIGKDGIKHPPQFKVDGQRDEYESLLDLKQPNTHKIKINMITNQGNEKKWKWSSFARGYKPEKDFYQITSVEDVKDAVHHYCLHLIINTPFALQNYPGGEPRNRPTTYGNLSFGKQVGTVVVSGRPPKPIYYSIAII